MPVRTTPQTRTAAIAPAARMLGAGLLIAACLTPFAGRAQEVIVSHGISTFGNLAYPADMTHLAYVNPDAPKVGEFSMASFGTFDSLNPFSIQGSPAALASVPFESILTGTLDEIGASYCFLCTTMEYPSDRSWVIFNLRQDVKFSDGTPLTGEDVIFSYNLFRDKGIPEFRAIFNDQVASAELLDPYRVKFTFTPGIPYRDLPATVGGLTVFSKADVEGKGRDLEASSMESFIGSGAYLVDSVKPGEQIIYKRNPDYWGNAHPLNVGQNNFDRIRIEYFADPTAAFEAFKSGVYTFHRETSSKQWATGYDFPALTDGWVKQEQIANGNMPRPQAFQINLRKERFQDPKVRQALGLMFNFEWSNQTLFYGLYGRVNSIFQQTAMEAIGPAGPEETAILQPLVDEGLLPASILTEDAVTAPVSDPASQLDRASLRQASALLDEAGWPVGTDGIRRNAAGETLRVEIVEANPAFERIINPYVENLKALGVDAVLTMVDAAQLSARTEPPTFDFDMIVAAAINSYEPGAGMKQGYASETRDNSTRNMAGVADPAVDRLLDGVIAATTREELDIASRALDRVLRHIRFWVPQWYNPNYWVATWDVYGRPEAPPKYDLGQLSVWWYDAEAAERLKAAGALK